jgi:hypothetical protein
MKNILIFVAYFLLGAFLIFSFRKFTQTMSSQQLKSPLPSFSFSLTDAPNESLKGEIVSLSGNVGWQSRTATIPAQITGPMPIIQQGEEIKTLDSGVAELVFLSNADITINPKTEVDVVQTLPTNILFGQNSGIADYKKLGTVPLSVRSQNLLVKINQGEITISVSQKQPYITVDVINGSATVGYNDINFVTQILDITSGKSLLFNTESKKVKILKD